MINELIIAEVFNGPLCIEKQYLQAQAMAAMGMIKSPGVMFKQASKHQTPYAVSQTGATQTSEFKPGSVGIVTLDGPVVENSDPYYGIKGTAEIAAELLAMDADSNTIGQVFCCNTGGGAAYAMKVLEDVFSQLQKPVGLFAKQILCSAGYGIGAHADFIMMYHPQGIVGSIGTMCSFSDMQPMFEKWGMQFHEIYATLSTLKNKTYNDALEGNYETMRKKMLDPMNEKFIAKVQDLRGDKISTTEKGIYKGETFMASQALELGLIDSVGSLNDAIAQVRQMATSNSKPKKAPITSAYKTDPNMKFPKLLALMGKKDPTQEELDEVNAELAENGVTGVGIYPESVITEAAITTSALATAQLEITRISGELSTTTASLTTVNAEVVTLKEKLAKNPAAVAPKIEPVETLVDKTQEQLNQEEIDNLPHNRAIANNPLFNKKASA